jgi:hypothetical protein
MSMFKVKYLNAPGTQHVYLRVFVTSDPPSTWAALGNLTVRKTEFEDFKRAFSGATFEDEWDPAMRRPTESAAR